MLKELPTDIQEFMAWSWDEIRPYADQLLAEPLSAENVEAWLAGWSRLVDMIAESYNRLYVRTTTHTNDEAGQERFERYVEDVIPRSREFDQAMKEKLLASGLEPEGFAIPLRRMRTDAAIFRAENLPLHTELEKIEVERSKITGGWGIEWGGEELTYSKAVTKLQSADRSEREGVWRRLAERIRQDRAAVDDLWRRQLDLRFQMARNAGFESYRDFRWQELARFDYTPDDCKAFHAAIEQVVVPAASRFNARRRAALGVDTLRVWDNHWFLSPDPYNRPPLKPFETVDELLDRLDTIFHRVDPVFGGYFRTMRADNLLDLDSRKNKAPGGYMTDFPYSGQPFIFAHAVGSHQSVITLLHEGGHAFHVYETLRIPYVHQRSLEFIPMEFAEVGSMAMELLASPYLEADAGGFYSAEDAARARVEHLEHIVQFWPYMSVVDSFQHWVYEHPEQARDPQQCDEAWFTLYRRFLPDLDWSGMEDDLRLLWRVQGHIFDAPFYYIEYGQAQLGAVQVWARALDDQAGAVANYRRALALGNTVTLPELYEAAGARLAFDAATLREAVDLIERTIEELNAL
ncbi:MAG: M3 family oligoendopeptidase [Chloroflexi bacterium]|nr:M3 family oligoendopeptidase [Chloroflexota bacterium]